MNAAPTGSGSAPTDEPVTRIDFFCIGAPKTASTWLADCLSENPSILIPSVKEPNFYVAKTGLIGIPNPAYLREPRWYASLYEGDPERRRGDFSVNLMHNIDTAPALLHRYHPEARLLVMLREPVERAHSQYWYFRRRNPQIALPDFESALRSEEFQRQALYAPQLEAWLARFNPSQVHYIFDFEIKRDGLGVVQRVARFVGADSSHVPAGINRRANPSREKKGWYRAVGATSRMAQKVGLRRLVRRANTTRMAAWIDSRGSEEKPVPPLSKEARERCVRVFESDVARLEARYGWDLSPWRKSWFV
jgi:hypothetical protein